MIVSQERIEDLLKMKSPIEILITLCRNKNTVSKYHEFWYGKPNNTKGFYCGKNREIYCVDEPLVIAHELTHGILTNYFNKHIPIELQHIICHWVEKELQNKIK